MKDFKRLLSLKLETGQVTMSEIARAAGYKNITPLSKYLNDEKREFDCITRIIKISNYLFSNDLTKEKSIIEAYSETVDPNKEISRQTLEYLSYHSLISYRNSLLEKMYSCNNKESKEMATIYKYEKLWDNTCDKLEMIEDECVKSDNNIIYKKYLRMCCFYLEGHSSMVEYMHRRIVANLNRLGDSYIKESYQLRIFKLLAAFKLGINKPEECEEMALFVIGKSRDRNTAASMYQLIGMSYLYRDYAKGRLYLEKAHDIFHEIEEVNGDNSIYNSLSLHDHYWGKEENSERFMDRISSCSNKALITSSAIGNIASYTSLMQNTDKASMNNRDLAFYYYSLGYLSDDEELLWKSIKLFKSIDDSYYVKLPIAKLDIMGTCKQTLEVASL
ncbi:AimR family lysis-lysogeny pheromone receptor [Alkalihalophilus pseudofirmus]|uniref:AimR family lysis-lysogeny pheromone receptor n=1 Tax=Alkalihalophilus pseudofirmus TaxID=79885 RepID=UPI00259BD202|nr:AimR family lysis-lysogeny pheromone receptor [Alkalihalophilus pseudofirmus]WEG18576.1 AimR family lysis-lysogeny pheromone receptor [Alkalihalophilus pseudofirmus]